MAASPKPRERERERTSFFFPTFKDEKLVTALAETSHSCLLHCEKDITQLERDLLYNRSFRRAWRLSNSKTGS